MLRKANLASFRQVGRREHPPDAGSNLGTLNSGFFRTGPEESPGILEVEEGPCARS